MTIKRFVAPDMRRALEMVRNELGPEAIILSSQRTKQGVEIITSAELDPPTRGSESRREFGQRFDPELDLPLASDQAWKQQKQIADAAESYHERASAAAPGRAEALAAEIEAARERMFAARERVNQRAPAQAQAAAPRTRTAEPQPESAELHAINPFKLDRQMDGLAEQVRSRAEEQAAHEAQLETGRLSLLQNEIADMRLLLEQQMWRMREDTARAPRHEPEQTLASEALNNRLTHLGLPTTLVRQLSALATPGKHLSVAWRESLARLAQRIPVDTQDPIDKGGVFAFVGPTGVGKTTTIAKLAARYVLQHGLGKVALVTTDTYRVGAHDQLRALGRILNVPVRVVDQERSLPQMVASLRNFPLILIDTAGFRQGDPLLKEQEAMLDSCTGITRILALACNSQVQTLKASTHAYSRGQLAGCVLTKLDESMSLGEVLGVVIERQLPVLYASDGQGIPKDIAPAAGHKLVAKAVAILKSQQTGEPVAAGQG